MPAHYSPNNLQLRNFCLYKVDLELKPTKTLPDHYSLDVTLDLSKNLRVMVWLNLVGLVLFFLFGALFWGLFTRVRPDFNLRPFGTGTMVGLMIFVIVSVLVIVIHELVHGFFFWIYLRERPTIGFRGAYAFAAAPSWYIPRSQFMVIGLAPLVVISAVGLLMLNVIPDGLLSVSLFGLTFNAAGAVGDLFVVGWLLTKPGSVLVNDKGDRFSIFVEGS
jgi:hypothetical protein